MKKDEKFLQFSKTFTKLPDESQNKLIKMANHLLNAQQVSGKGTAAKTGNPKEKSAGILKQKKSKTEK